MYPNPNHGKFSVNLGNDIQGEAHITVYNALGMQVYQTTSKQSTADSIVDIDLNQPASGIYFVSVECSGVVTMAKVSVVGE